MKNESPIGLATILGLAPALVAGVVFVVLLILNGGDVEQATALTIAIIGALSLVGTAALRQWRAVRGADAGATVIEPRDDDIPGGELVRETPTSNTVR